LRGRVEISAFARGFADRERRRLPCRATAGRARRRQRTQAREGMGV
jgi:hypothetical protein